MNFRDGKLTKNWVYDSKVTLNSAGAGAHSEMAGDTQMATALRKSSPARRR